MIVTEFHSSIDYPYLGPTTSGSSSNGEVFFFPGSWETLLNKTFGEMCENGNKRTRIGVFDGIEEPSQMALPTNRQFCRVKKMNEGLVQGCQRAYLF